MDGASCPPYPHHSWLAQWLSVQPPLVLDVHERRHVTHHLQLTTSGDAEIRCTCHGAETTCHSVAGSLGFFPCDHLTHGMSITAADGFLAYDVMIPDRHLQTVCATEGLRPAREFRALPDFRDALIQACLRRLSARPGGHRVPEDIGDEIAARQIVLRLSVLNGGTAPDWQTDGSVFTPAVLRQLVALIDAHLGVPMSLRSLASTVRLSPGHFARRFHKSAGLSLNRFLNMRRIAASFALLQSDAGSLAGIGLDLGFSSQSHFTRLFSSLTGLSPRRFRALHRRMVG
jgi:AraC-like DNA-binding protein